MKRWIRWTALAIVVIAVVASFFVPFIACPSCSGSGSITVMESHPEAMGSTGRLTKVECPMCEGKARVSLVHRSVSRPPALSRR